MNEGMKCEDTNVTAGYYFYRCSFDKINNVAKIAGSVLEINITKLKRRGEVR